MIQEPSTGELRPFDFNHLLEQVPELNRLEVDLETYSFEQPVDSSNMTPTIWKELAEVIIHRKDQYQGFVVLHGSDTMAYTASALSFLLAGLGKPVILTGSQLPMGIIRTDGKENFITSIEIASARHMDGSPIVQEVAVYFEYRLYRGNRTTKISASHFDAFSSPNYPVLAEAGVDIRYNREALWIPEMRCYEFDLRLNQSVSIIKIFPGMSERSFRNQLEESATQAFILETFGAGNAPSHSWFTNAIRQTIVEGKAVINITQCLRGQVNMAKYTTGIGMMRAGVASGHDCTTEAAITKLMVLMGRGYFGTELSKAFTAPICGEITVAN